MICQTSAAQRFSARSTFCFFVCTLPLLACSSSDARGGTTTNAGGSSAGAAPIGGNSNSGSSAGTSAGETVASGGSLAGGTGVAGGGAAGAGIAGAGTAGAGAGAQGGAAGEGSSAGRGGVGGSTAGNAAGGDSTGGAASLGGSSLCDASKYAICESFEGGAVGSAAPSGWTAAASNYGPGTLGIAEDQAARGKHSFKIALPNGAGSTEKFLQHGSLGALANAHYGRVFYRIQSPTTTAFVHWDLVVGAGSFNGSNRRVRWGVTGTGVGTSSSNWSWIYNIEQGDKGDEDRTAHPQLAQWQCLEWRWAGGATQEMRFYLDGKESTRFQVNGTLKTGASPELPVFSSLNFGISSFHALNMPLVIWIDEIAIDPARIGCSN